MKSIYSKTKRRVLIIASAGVLLLVLLFILGSSSCYKNEVCREIARNTPNDDMLQVLFILPVLFLLSLITYRMHDNVFRAWWNFARWWAVVIVVVTILLNFSSGGGYIGMDMEFTALIHTILYGTLIITSIVKIYRAYWANSIQS